MRCEQAQTELSNRIDGRATAVDQRALDEHLASCLRCRDWLRRAHLLKRSSIEQAADATAPSVSIRPAGFVGFRWARAVLAGAGVALLAWNVPEMIAAGSETAVHLSRHQAAFGAALGLAFLFVTVRPDRAYGLVPFAATFILALGSTALVDLMNGVSTPGREARHLVEILGLAVLLLLGLMAGPGSFGARIRSLFPRSKSQNPHGATGSNRAWKKRSSSGS